MTERKRRYARFDSRLSTVTLWLCSAFAALGVHAGVLAWMLADPPSASDGELPAAIMIDLSPEPAAAESGEDNATTEGAVEPVTEPEKNPPPEPEPEPEPEPPPTEPEETPPGETPVQEPDPEPPEPVEEEAVEPEEVAVPLPVPPRKPEIRPVVRQRETPRKTDPAPVAKPAATRTLAPAAVSENAASPQAAGGRTGPSAESVKWSARLMAHLERRKRYPSGARSRGEEGTVHVRFLIDDAGNVLSVSLEKTSGHAELDAEVLSLVRRASPVPAPPPDAGKNVVAPVRFTIR